jgi:hypothetical protein
MNVAAVDWEEGQTLERIKDETRMSPGVRL